MEINRPYLHIRNGRPGSPGAGSHSIVVNLEPATLRPLKRRFAVVSEMPHRRRRVFVDTPKGRRSAGFTVPASADAAEVSMALRRRGWSPYALRLEPEQNAWVALVMDWRRAA